MQNTHDADFHAAMEAEYQRFLVAKDLYNLLSEDDPRRNFLMEHFILGFGG